MKLSLKEAKVIKLLSESEKQQKNASFLAITLQTDLFYMYQILRQLKVFGYLTEHRIGRKKYFEPTKKAIELADNKISEEIQKRIEKDSNSEGVQNEDC